MSAHGAQIQPAGRRARRRLRIFTVSVAAVASGAIPLAAHGTAANATAPAVAGSREMHRLEAHGYVASACTPKGTLLVNSSTGRQVTVDLA